jgi:outer membrane protein OmpA-like peptidoglycan-associated protein/ABC-type nitrate/sulfonate/bicarbonate transport system substrate-binding protein
MAVKIEKGGWILIFIIGLGLVGFGLNKYGYLDLSKWTGKSSSGSSKIDTSKPLELPVSTSSSDDNPEIRVRVNVWVGCAGGLVANGGLETAPDSIFAQKGLKVSFKIIDDWTEGASALATNNVDIMLTTLDVYAKDYGQFQEKGFGSHTFLMVDWSRGADGVIGKQGINSIEDLAGKTVAFAPYTPSHFLLWNGLKASGLSTEQRNEIFKNAVHTKDGIEPAVLFAQDKVDAAVAWDPDMSDAVGKRAGSKKIYDTRIANRLIADILVVSDRFAARHPQTLVKFSQGWLEGVEFIKNHPERAYNLIGTVKDFNIPADLAKTMLGGVKLADYADNNSFLGSSGSNSDYANIFGMAQDMYREMRMIKHISGAEESVDRRYIQQLSGSGFSTASSEAPIEYHAPAKSAVPLATQHRSIYFDPASARMSLDSRAVVDEIGSQMQAYQNTVVDIEGNTDSTGGRAYNVQLSHQRADTVKQYLIDKYRFPAARLRTAGNGPDHPIDTNATPEGREKNRRTDIKLYANPGQ